MAAASIDNGNGKKAVEGHTNTAGMDKNDKEDDYKDGYDEGKSKYDEEEEETYDSNESDEDSEEDDGEDDSDEDSEEGSEEDDGEDDSDEGSEEDDGEDDSDENSEEDDSEDNSDEDSEEEDEEDDEDGDNNAKEGRAIFEQNKRRPAGSSSAEVKREGNDDTLPTTYLQPKEADDDVGPLDTFTITVGGICLDSHIHPSVKARYWALCSSRGAILHHMGLLRFHPLAVGLVVKYFVQLADNIREVTPELSIYMFDRWIYISKSLESIKCFDIGFLLKRIQQLRSFLSGDQGMPLIKEGCLRGRLGDISQELQELKCEIKRLMLNQTQEMQDVEVRIEPLIRKMKELDTIKQDMATELSDLLPMVDACRDAFAELAAAPW